MIEPPARPSKRSRPSLGDALDGDQQQHGLLSLAVPANKGRFGGVYILTLSDVTAGGGV